jgi:hypothetical protein
MLLRPARWKERTGMELRIPVWQFVRIMVHLEGDSGRGKSKGESVYGDWLDAWTELDAHLTKLGKTNADGFADLMMEQEVLVVCRGQARLAELRRTIDTVARRMKADVRHAADAEHKRDLRREARGLEALSRDLAKRQKGEGP